MKQSGCATLRSIASSPRRACPETWTGSCAEWITSAPRRCNSSMIRPTDHSLPGMGWADSTTTSSDVRSSHFDWPAAMRDIAAIGSPCDPVERTQISPGSKSSIFVMSTRTPSGTIIIPNFLANSTLFFIDRPRVATFRPDSCAASMIC